MTGKSGLTRQFTSMEILAQVVLARRLRAVKKVVFMGMGMDAVREIVRYLHSRGVLTKVRNSAGQDVDGGCGQLRARAVGAAQVVKLQGRKSLMR